MGITEWVPLQSDCAIGISRDMVKCQSAPIQNPFSLECQGLCAPQSGKFFLFSILEILGEKGNSPPVGLPRM